MRVTLCFLCTSIVALAGCAAEISGKWSGNIELKLPDGTAMNQPAWAEFSQNGHELSGTAGGGDSDESLPIENGIIDGKKVAFQFTGLDGRVYKASLVSASEDCLEGTLAFALPDGTPMTAKLTLKHKKMP